MSEENEQGDDNQKDASEVDEFQFYFSFTKPLVLELPSSEDRAVAAAWVQKLEAEPESEEEKQQRLNYLKLLLFVLQRGRLSGIFKKQPPSGPLQPFPQGFSILDMGNWMLDQDDGQASGGGDARSLPYTVELSNDLREFVASQEVPNFGIQMYYAWSSDEPIHKWESFDEEKFPQFILDKIKQLKETKSDEKSYIVKNGCLTKKKGCDITLQDKFSKKKVKSPQEIERSQGRSFHTYMGLVGRMGNFNDKCDDDPEKFQRQDPRKMKCQRRNVPKRCPGNGGEAEDMAPEEEFDTFVTGLGGLNAQNKSCACPNPCHHQQNRPDFQPKGGPQSYENSQGACRNISIRGDVENTQYAVPVNKPATPRRPMREPPACPDIEMPEMMPQQKCPSPRSRNNSPARNMECPPPMSEGTSERFEEKTGICICSSPCPCPCPRGKPQKATSNANSVERACSPEPSRNQGCPPQSSRSPACPQPSRNPACSPEPPRSPTCPRNSKSPRPESGCPPDGYRPPYNSLRSFENNANNNTTSITMSDLSPIRSTGGMKYGVPEIVHCYNARNPDPSLAPKLEKQWTQVARGFNRDLDVDFKNYLSRDQTGGSSRQACTPNARRANFAPQAQSTPINQRSYHQSDRSTKRCPPLSRPEISGVQSNPCDYSNPEDAQPPCPARPRQQASYEQQQLQQTYLECPEEAPPPRLTSDPCRAPPPMRAPDSCGVPPPMHVSDPCGAPSPMRASDACGAPQRMRTDPSRAPPPMRASDPCRAPQSVRASDPCRAPQPMRASDPCGAPQRMRSPDSYRAAPSMRAPDSCGAPPPMHAPDSCGAPPPMRATDPFGAPPCMRAPDPFRAPPPMRASDPCGAPPPMRATDPCGAPPSMRATDPCGAPPPMRASDPCGLRPKPDTYNKKCPPLGMSKPKNTSTFAVNNDSGRLANMVTALQGMKQRTEGQRDKYETVGVRRSPPPNDAACYPGNVQAPPKPQSPPKGRPQQIGFDEGVCGGEVNSPRNGRSGQQMYYSPQSKPAQAFSPVSQRGVNASNKVCPTQQQVPQRTPQQMRPPQSVSPDCYPMSQNSYEDADVCQEEEDFECASFEDMDAGVPAPPAPQNMSRSKAQPLGSQAGRRNSPGQECSKPMPPRECEQQWPPPGDDTMDLLNECDYWSGIATRGSPRGGMNQSDVNEGYIDAPLDFSGVRDYSSSGGNRSLALMDVTWPPLDGSSCSSPSQNLSPSRQSPRQQNVTPVEDVIPFLRQGSPKAEQGQQETYCSTQDDYDDTDDTCATFNVMPEEDFSEQNFETMPSDTQGTAIEGPEECQDSNDGKWVTMSPAYFEKRYPCSPDPGTQGHLNSRDPQCQQQFSSQNRGYEQ